MVGEQHVPLTAEREAAILREIRERGVGSSILFAFLRQGFTDYERDKRHKAPSKQQGEGHERKTSKMVEGHGIRKGLQGA